MSKTSMMFESFALKRPRVFKHILSGFTCSFCLEIHVRGDKIMLKHVWVVNVWENISTDHPRFLEEGHSKSAQDCPRLPKPLRQSTPVGYSMPRR